MKAYEFTDQKGTFTIDQPEDTSYLYFPIAGENGLKGAVTPGLGGDLKTDQNHFVLQPVSAEDLHNNKSSRNFWCCMEEGGNWSATGISAEAQSEKFKQNQDKSSVTAGLMWHRLKRVSNQYQLESEITSFVPLGNQRTEVMLVTLKNTGMDTVSFTPVAAVPIYGRSADNLRDHRHVTSLLHRIETTEYGVEVTPTLSFDERGHQKNTTIYYVCGITGKGQKPEGYYPVLEDFIGEGGSLEHPAAVVRRLEGVLAGARESGWEAMGGIQFQKETLQPGESAAYTVLIGLADSWEEIRQTAIQFQTAEKVEQCLDQVKEYWQNCNNVAYETGDSRFDNWMYWVNFQPILRRIYGCSFLPHHDYGKGGRGWRDLWQDCLALLVMEPSGVRELLVHNFAGVRMDGSNATIIGSEPGEFVADRNQITRVWMDHGFWPLLTTNLYIHQTGDMELLLEEQQYFKDKQAARGTAADEKWNTEYGTCQKDETGNIITGTVLEHLLLQNLTVFYETGDHNHLRLRGADWNDALDMAEENGESVAFTAAYSGNLRILSKLLWQLAENGIPKIQVAQEMAVLFTGGKDLYEDSKKKQKLLASYLKACEHELSGSKISLSCKEAAQNLLEKSQWMQEHIRETEWIRDSQKNGWFNSYYDNHGNQAEGVLEEGKVRMMLTGQVFAIMSGTAQKEQISEIVKAADRYLYQKSVGGYRLNTDFGEVKTDLGRMFGFAYGQKENGAVFSHMTVMFGNALYEQGFVKEGYQALHSLYEQAADFEASHIYPGIPEYFNGRGRGMYHYLTGAASWMMLTVVQQMFGIKGTMGNLKLEPKLLKEQFDQNGNAGITLTFAGRNLHAVYKNPEKKEYGAYRIKSVFLNGYKMKNHKTNHSFEIPRSILEALSVEGLHEILLELN